MGLSFKGEGLLNKILTTKNFPFELHVPTYRYCGPFTRLHKRLARGDLPKNKLDRACLYHDIVYDRTTNLRERQEADRTLAKRAAKRLKARDSTLGERLVSLALLAAMKTKLCL